MAESLLVQYQRDKPGEQQDSLGHEDRRRSPRRQFDCWQLVAEYDGKPISSSELAMLESAGQGNGVRVILLTGREAMEQVLEYVVQANTAQMHDRAFIEELKASASQLHSPDFRLK